MAPLAFSAKPASGLSDHKYICTGKGAEGAKILLGASATKATIPITSKGEVSPIILAKASKVPVTIPGIAKGMV